MGLLADLWRAIRTVLGGVLVTLLLLVVVLEASYLAYHTAQKAFWGTRPMFESSDHPYWREPWYAGWPHRVNQLALRSVYDPYRGWHLPPISEPGLHVDQDGIRLTVHRIETDTAASRRVFLLGGSTMWGYSARDEYTIPSLVADRLAQGGITDVEVVNLASIGYNTTQGAITLLLELRRGNVPSAVVSLDGINEVGIVYAGGRPGEVYLQALAERQFDHGSFWREVARLRQHLRGTSIAEVVLLRSLGWLKSPPMDQNRVCADVAGYYAEVVRSLDAVAREHRIPIFHLTTPTLSRSHKPPTRWETSLQAESRGLQELSRRCGHVTDSLMAPKRGTIYFPLDSLFDRDTSTVFLDHYGHVTERANGAIADRIAGLIIPVLQPASRP